MDGSHSPLPPDLKRRRFTAADVQAMLEAGILREGERVELVGGELIEMSPQGPLHWDITHRLGRWMRRNLPATLDYAVQGPLRLGADDELEPDIFVFRDGIAVNDVRGADVLLVVQVSRSRLAFDLHAKAAMYARHGVLEYWVVDADQRRTLVHRLVDGGYSETEVVPFSAALLVPAGLTLTIADLEPRS